jgi:hypothetical protein
MTKAFYAEASTPADLREMGQREGNIFASYLLFFKNK